MPIYSTIQKFKSIFNKNDNLDDHNGGVDGFLIAPM